MNATKPNPDSPRFAVGIPALDETRGLRELVQETLRQASAIEGFSGLFINVSGSSEAFAGSVRDFASDLDAVTVIEEADGPGKASALGGLARAVSAPILVFVDGDVVPSDGFLHRLIERLDGDEGVGLVTGDVGSRNRVSTFFGYISHFQRRMHHRLNVARSARGAVPKVNGTFYAFRRELVPRFPTEVSSDDEYASALVKRSGFGVAYEPEAVVETRDPEDPLDYLRKRIRILTGHRHVHRRFGHRPPTLDVGDRIRTLGPTLRDVGMRLPCLLTMALLEGLASLAARMQVLLGRTEHAYRSWSAKLTEEDVAPSSRED